MRRLTIMLAIVLGLVLMSAAPAWAFSDVPADHPYAVAIADLSARGIIDGFPSGRFGPGDPVTRQQFAKMIALTLDLPVSEADVCPFGDVETAGPGILYPDHYVAACAARGITLGTSPTTFSPSLAISRAQVVTMVVRAIGCLHVGELVLPSPGYLSSWNSGPTHGPSAAKAEYNHLLDGLPLDSADAWEPMPRGEVAQVLWNALHVLAGDPTVSIRLVAIGPFSGPLALIGLDSLNAVNMAVEEFNAANPKIRVSVDVGDDLADPAVSAAAAWAASRRNSVMGVVGPMTSSGVQAALPVLEGGRLSMVSQSARNDRLSQQGFAVFHRIAPSDGAQGVAMAGLVALDLQATRVFIVDDDSAYSRDLADQVEQALHGTYHFAPDQVRRARIHSDDSDVSDLVLEAKAYGPDVFVATIASAPQYVAIAKQMEQMAFKVQLVGGDGMRDQAEFIDNAAGTTEGAFLTMLGPILEGAANPKAVEFVNKFRARYGALSLFAGQSYDAANVMLDAFKRAYAAARGKITRDAVAHALASTRYDGVLGFTIQFRLNGDLTSNGIFIAQVRNGGFVQVKLGDY